MSHWEWSCNVEQTTHMRPWPTRETVLRESTARHTTYTRYTMRKRDNTGVALMLGPKVAVRRTLSRGEITAHRKNNSNEKEANRQRRSMQMWHTKRCWLYCMVVTQTSVVLQGEGSAVPTGVEHHQCCSVACPWKWAAALKRSSLQVSYCSPEGKCHPYSSETGPHWACNSKELATGPINFIRSWAHGHHIAAFLGNVMSVHQ